MTDNDIIKEHIKSLIIPLEQLAISFSLKLVVYLIKLHYAITVHIAII